MVAHLGASVRWPRGERSLGRASYAAHGSAAVLKIGMPHMEADHEPACRRLSAFGPAASFGGCEHRSGFAPPRSQRNRLRLHPP